MKLQYHRAITRQALEERVAPAVLETIIAANLGQDALPYQIGHDHFHYDSNSFAAGDAYLEEQRRLIADALARGQALAARQAFGRLTHTVQDFYAHSNYVALWRERNPAAAPEHIRPQLEEILGDARLHSGRLYYPLEVLSFVPGLQPLVLPLLPRDSHAWMNKDDPSRPDFEFAYAAAVQRTAIEFQHIVGSTPASQTTLFTGQSSI